MKCQKQKSLAGFTIIEVMIFLVVSSALLISAVALVGGQQNRTQFTTSTREFESRLQSLVGDVETGFFPDNSQLSCKLSGPSDPFAYPLLSDAPANKQGTNEDCVFLGKVIQFYKNSDGVVSSFRTVNIAGKRQVYNAVTRQNEDPSSMEAFQPRAYYEDGRTALLDENQISYGIEVKKVLYVTNFSPLTTTEDFNEIAVVPSVVLQKRNNVVSNLGNGRATIAALRNGSGFNDDIASLANSVNSLTNASIENASRGLIICLNDNGGRAAAVTMGLQLADTGGGSFVAQPTSQQITTNLFLDNEVTALGCPR